MVVLVFGWCSGGDNRTIRTVEVRHYRHGFLSVDACEKNIRGGWWGMQQLQQQDKQRGQPTGPRSRTRARR